MKSKQLRAHMFIVACLSVSLSACTLEEDGLNNEPTPTNNATNTMVTGGSTTAINTSTKGSMNTAVVQTPTNTMASATGGMTSTSDSNSVVTSDPGSTITTITSDTGGGGTSTTSTCPSPRDGDGDGLTDCEEADIGTDPTKKDTDSDGLADGDEVVLGTDPTNLDSDGDTLTDFEEVQQNTDPNKKDSDMDGLDDNEEAKFGFNPGKPSTFGNGVFDGDLFIVKACDVPESEPVIFKSSAKGDWLMGLPVAFSNYTELHITSAGPEDAIAVYDDPVNEVSGFIISTKTTGQSAIRTLVGYKPEIEAVSTITQDLIQGEFETQDKNKAAPGEYRITVSNKAVNEIRNDLLFGFSTFTPADVTNLPTSAGNKYGQYYMQVTVIERSDRILTTVALAPEQYFDQFDAVRFRMNDLVNTTSITKAGDEAKLRCYPFPASTEVPAADFYWVLDQSGSMNDDYDRVKSFARDFYERLQTTSLDFRLGVANMEERYKGKLRAGGPLWHDDPDVFIKEINDYVIDCPSPCSGSAEHGLYSAREGLKYMKSSVAPANEQFRPAAQVATIIMSDEEDQSVKNRRDPGGMTMTADDITKAYETFFSAANNPLQFASPPLVFSIVSPGGACRSEHGAAYESVALASGGAVASLCSNDLKETLNQIVDIIIARSSVFDMPQTPISSTLRVYQGDAQGINGIWVPRSRQEGFDYFPQTNSLAFFGSFRPKASTRTACSVADPCMTPGESCKDSVCVLDISAQIAVHYQYFRRDDKPNSP